MAHYKKILILGGSGQMGRHVYEKLFRLYDTCSGDIVRPSGPEAIKHVRFDIANSIDKTTVSLFRQYDLIINCLPAAVGMRATKLAAYSGVDCVDLSFSEGNPFAAHDKAENMGCCIIPDAGFAPGLSNLFVGEEIKKYDYDGVHSYIRIYVGGVAKSPFAPLRHAHTWSAADLLEEYTRPARTKRNHKIMKRKPLTTVESRMINGVLMESFEADGLRTLLHDDLNIANISERTLRWPGHLRAIKPLIKGDVFVETIENHCVGLEDTCILYIDFFNGKKSKRISMVDHAVDGVSSMARLTAYTCAATARMVLEGVYKEPGVHPLEHVGQNKKAYNFILDQLKIDGIEFEIK